MNIFKIDGHCSRLFGIKIREILILQKIDKKWSVPVEIPEKKVDVGPLFSTFLEKKHVTSVVFISLSSIRITLGSTIGIAESAYYRQNTNLNCVQCI